MQIKHLLTRMHVQTIHRKKLTPNLHTLQLIQGGLGISSQGRRSGLPIMWEVSQRFGAEKHIRIIFFGANMINWVYLGPLICLLRMVRGRRKPR